MQRLRDIVGWTMTRMAELYSRRLADAYKQDVIDWFDNKVDLGLAEVEKATSRIRALMPVPGPVQSRSRKKVA